MVSVAIQSLTDEQLRCTLTDHHVTVGPITKSTRKIYERKLARLRKELPALKLGDNNSEEEPTATEEAEMEVEEEMEDEEEVVVEKIPVVTRQYRSQTPHPNNIPNRELARSKNYSRTKPSAVWQPKIYPSLLLSKHSKSDRHANIHSDSSKNYSSDDTLLLDSSQCNNDSSSTSVSLYSEGSSFHGDPSLCVDENAEEEEDDNDGGGDDGEADCSNEIFILENLPSRKGDRIPENDWFPNIPLNRRSTDISKTFRPNISSSDKRSYDRHSSFVLPKDPRVYKGSNPSAALYTDGKSHPKSYSRPVTNAASYLSKGSSQSRNISHQTSYTDSVSSRISKHVPSKYRVDYSKPEIARNSPVKTLLTTATRTTSTTATSRSIKEPTSSYVPSKYRTEISESQISRNSPQANSPTISGLIYQAVSSLAKTTLRKLLPQTVDTPGTTTENSPQIRRHSSASEGYFRPKNTPKTQIGTPFITSGYSHSASRSQVGTPYVSSGLSRRPLNTNTNYYQDNKTYTSLRKQETSSSSSSSAATAAKKSGMSWFSKLLVMVLLGLVLWMVYLNFDPEMPKE